MRFTGYIEKKRYSVLCVSGEKGAQTLSELLGNDFIISSHAKNAGEARRILTADSFDIVLINAPLTDEFGHELAMDITETSSSSVMLIVKSEMFDEVNFRVSEYGIYTVSKPLNRQFFEQAMKLLCSARERLQKLEKQNDVLKTKLDEIKIIDRAKCLLIEYLKLSEKEAHKYIEKLAMDERKSKLAVAMRIIKDYGI